MFLAETCDSTTTWLPIDGKIYSAILVMESRSCCQLFVKTFCGSGLDDCIYILMALCSVCQNSKITSSSAMAGRLCELDQRFQMGGQFEAIID